MNQIIHNIEIQTSKTYHWTLTLLEVSGFAVEDSSLLGCDSVAG